MDASGLATLRNDIALLDAALLALVQHAQPDPLDASEKVYINAYLVLSHAEVEGFIEQCFRDYVATSLTLDELGRVDPGLYQIVVKLAPELEGAKTVAPSDLLKGLPGRIENKVLKPNNGIREQNMRQLAVGCGLNWPHFEDGCGQAIGAFDALGAARGGPAHVGNWAPPSGIVEQLYPDNVRELVNEALDQLEIVISYLGSSPTQRIEEIGSFDWLMREARRHMRKALRSLGAAT